MFCFVVLNNNASCCCVSHTVSSDGLTLTSSSNPLSTNLTISYFSCSTISLLYGVIKPITEKLQIPFEISERNKQKKANCYELGYRAGWEAVMLFRRYKIVKLRLCGSDNRDLVCGRPRAHQHQCGGISGLCGAYRCCGPPSNTGQIPKVARRRALENPLYIEWVSSRPVRLPAAFQLSAFDQSVFRVFPFS